MMELLRLVLILALAGAAVTFFAAAAGWYMEEERRMNRAFSRVLGAPPDAVIIARGRGRAAAFSFSAGSIATAWSGGSWCLVFSLAELLGGEIILDGQVAGRVMRGEPRRALDRLGDAHREVRLRLMFDDPQHPDFDLILWPTGGHRPRGPATAGEAVSEANQWLARADAVLRRAAAGQAAVIRPEPAAHRPPAAAGPPIRSDAPEAHFEDDDDFEDEDEGPPF
ncbi:MAG: hypothetical protein ACHP84_12345 [Caulobacterales bacterium]